MSDTLTSLTSKDIHKVLIRDIDMFARVTMPDYFTTKFGDFHKEIFDVWDSDEEFVMLIMPRGFGKTTLVQMLMAREGLYGRSNFTLFISDTGDQAEEKLEALKEEFEVNDRIEALFGPQRNKKKWLKGNFKINAGCKYKCRGAGQSMRGVKDGPQRPDLIIVDDLENDEHVGTPQQREKLHKWFYAALLPTAVRHGRRIRLVGTIIEAESFITTIMEQTKEEIAKGLKPTWHILIYGILNDKNESIWPEFVSTENALAEKEMYKHANVLDIWYREKMSMIASDSGKLPPKLIRKISYANEIELRAAMNQCIAIVVSHDPAISDNPKADRAAITVVGFTGQAVIIFDGHREVGMPPDDQVMKALDYANKYYANVVVYEKVAFQAALKFSYARLRGRFAYSVDVDAYTVPRNKSKILRIEHAIRSILLAGDFYCVDHIYDIVYEEMASHPNGKRDFIDSIAQAIHYQVENDLYMPQDIAGIQFYEPAGESQPWAV